MNAVGTSTTEQHPLQPFLPKGARLLLLGSFPPPKERWCMDFFYPNPQNDMWRIMGLVFYGDRNRFLDPQGRLFLKPPIVDFCTERGLAIYDTAQAVRRLRGNASDAFLEVVTPTDINGLLAALPGCTAVCTTGQKATDTLCSQLRSAAPAVGGSTEVQAAGRTLRFYRMPSSSRAYPLPLDRKAAAYRSMFLQEGML